MITSKDFFLALDQLEKEKKISKEYFIDALKSALISAYKKHFGEARNSEVTLNPEKGTIKVVAYKTVVEEVEDPDKEISLEEAKQLKSTYKLGDTISEEVTPKNFGRIAAQTAKQVIMQKLREAERNNLSNELNQNGTEQLTTAIVRRKAGSNVYVQLGATEAEGVLGEKDIIPNEKLQIGQHIKVMIKKVADSGFGTEVQVSRTTTAFVKKLFELEVPEIASGEVVIKSIARKAGSRTKISVFAQDPNVDPVGACVGTRGARINVILAELGGTEKIDIVKYCDDVFEYIANALSPADVVSVEINEETKSSRVIVPDNKLSLAIGKAGVNVSLAAKLTGWKIDVKSETENQKDEESRQVQEFTPTFIDEGVDIFEDIQGIE